MLWGGKNTANKYHWHVWGVLAVSRPHWVCPCSRFVHFPSLQFSGSRLLCWETDAGPALHALPMSKLLMFRILGTSQRHRLGWACVLCPSHFRAAQVTRCLLSTLSPGGGVRLIASSVPAAQFSGYVVDVLSQVCHVFLLGR